MYTTTQLWFTATKGLSVYLITLSIFILSSDNSVGWCLHGVFLPFEQRDFFKNTNQQCFMATTINCLLLFNTLFISRCDHFTLKVCIIPRLSRVVPIQAGFNNVCSFCYSFSFSRNARITRWRTARWEVLALLNALESCSDFFLSEMSRSEVCWWIADCVRDFSAQLGVHCLTHAADLPLHANMTGFYVHGVRLTISRLSEHFKSIKLMEIC